MIAPLPCLLRNCKTQSELLQTTAQIIANGLHQCTHLAPKIISAFFHYNLPENATLWFSSISHRSAILWNVLFKEHTKRDAHRETLILFSRMRASGDAPNRYTFTFVLKSCTKIGFFDLGISIHGFSIKTGFERNRFAGTLLIELYSCKERRSESARKMFDEMTERNVVAWTAMVAAHLAAGEISAARSLFDQARERDVPLWNTIICGYIAAGDMAAARKLFDEMPLRDTMAWNSLLHGYAVAGELEECLKMFGAMGKRNVFSWNALIRGYLRHERYSEALCTFTRMVDTSEVLPNEATLAMALSACAKSGALAFGERLHLYAKANNFLSTIHVMNGIIDMYGKCGSLKKALRLFHEVPRKDIVTWNVVIGGLASHGEGRAALELFEAMKEEGSNPDGITFVGILSACSHLGLVEEGLKHFEFMVQDHKIMPWMEHYGCLVDLFCRAGLVEEALRVVEKMPMETDAVIWTTILSSCHARKFFEIAELAARQLSQLAPHDAANFVALSNVYGNAGEWEEFARAKILMREASSEKSIGCSFVEIDLEIVRFCSSDWRHERIGEIRRVLAHLIRMEDSGESAYLCEDGEFCM